MISRRKLLFASIGLAIASQWAFTPSAHAESRSGRRILVMDFDIVDTSQEPVDQRADHARRLERMRDDVARGLAAKGGYEVVDRSTVAADLDAIQRHTYVRTCNGCEFSLAQKADADLVLLGQVNKVSTLIMSMDVTIKNVSTGEMIFRQRFDFRGDNDYSWGRTTKYVVDRIAREPGS